MHGSLALKGGILHVASAAAPARVRPYDLDGRALGPGFAIGGVDGARPSIAGLAVDVDHRLWIADRGSARVRAFTAFGRELSGRGGREPADSDVAGALGRLAGVACAGVEDEALLVVASSGERRHALHAFDLRAERWRSLRPAGDPQGVFRDLASVAIRERTIWACERGAARVQVFREGEFHFAFRVESGAARAPEPRAIAPLSDGRLVVVVAGEDAAVLLVDAGGRTLRVLAGPGTETGEVFEPSDVVVDEGADESSTRVAVIDKDGDRVQVFTLAGRCFGSFSDLPHAAG